MELANKFWKEYLNVDELKRRELCLKLTGIDNLNASLMQSYFDDIIDFMEEKK